MRIAGVIILVLGLFIHELAFSQQQPISSAGNREWVRVETPGEGSEIIGKKPEIKVEFVSRPVRNNLLVILDGTDITPVLTLSDKGFSYRPVISMPAGAHTLVIAALDESGTPLQKTVTFKSRHFASVAEASSNNVASAIYTQAIVRPGSSSAGAGQTDFDSRIEGNLKTENRVREGNWDVTLNGNIRYLDQNAPVASPLEKGVDVANWLMTGMYAKEALRFQFNVGDVQVTETANTISLNRKGGLLQFNYDVFQLRAFSVKSQQQFGLHGGMGIGDPDQDILGTSAGVKLFQEKAEFRTIFLSGEGRNSQTNVVDAFGATGQPGKSRGEVVGYLLTTDFFQNRLKTEFEADFSKYDPDVSDEFDSRSDRAFLARAYGMLGSLYHYDAKYEYYGRDYNTLGNPGVLRNREGVSLSQGLNAINHSALVVFSTGNDNVEGDPLFARNHQYAGGLNYTFTGVRNLPLGLGYQKSLQRSRNEPAGMQALDAMTDTVSANVSWLWNNLLVGLSGLYSVFDDRTPVNADTTTATVTLSPTCNLPGFSVTPMYSWNQSKNETTAVRTDSHTGGLNLLSRFYGERLTFAMAGTYTVVKASDRSVDTRLINGTADLSYSLKADLLKHLNPVFTLRSTYVKTKDEVNPLFNSDNFGLFLVLTGTIPISF